MCVCKIHTVNVCLFVLQIFSEGAEPAIHFRGDRGLACIIGLTRGRGVVVYSGEYCGIVNFPVAGWGTVSIWEPFQTTQNPSGRDVIILSQHRMNVIQCFRGPACEL